MFLILFRRIRLLLLVIYFFIGWSMYFIEGGQIALWIPVYKIFNCSNILDMSIDYYLKTGGLHTEHGVYPFSHCLLEPLQYQFYLYQIMIIPFLLGSIRFYHHFPTM